MDVEETGIDDNGRFALSAPPPELPLFARKVTAGHELVKTVPMINNSMVKWKCSCGEEGMASPEMTGQAYQDHLPDMPRVVKPESPVRPDKPKGPEVNTRSLYFFDLGNEEPLVLAPLTGWRGPEGSRPFYSFSQAMSYNYLIEPIPYSKVYYPAREYLELKLLSVRMQWKESVKVMSKEDAHEQISQEQKEQSYWRRESQRRGVF